MNRREQTLAISLGVALLIGICVVAFTKMNKWKKDIELRDHALALKKVTADELMKQKDYWMARSDWLTAKQPVFTVNKDANNAIYDLVVKTAKEAGVTNGPPQPQPIDGSNPGLKAAGVMVSATGELEKVLRWLYNLQHAPDVFVSIKGMTLKPDQEDTSKVLVNDLHILKWYRDGGAADKPQSTEGQ